MPELTTPRRPALLTAERRGRVICSAAHRFSLASVEFERSCIPAGALGAMQPQLETCVRYAQARIGPQAEPKGASSPRPKRLQPNCAPARRESSPAWTRSRSTRARATQREPASKATCAMRLPARSSRERQESSVRGLGPDAGPARTVWAAVAREADRARFNKCMQSDENRDDGGHSESHPMGGSQWVKR
jgi:hypothetical protein